MSGSGVVSKVPSGLRSATTIAPVSCRIRRSRIVLPGGRAGRRTSISASWRSGPVAVVTTSRKAVTCGFSTRFAITWPAVEYGSTTRSAPASFSFRSADSVEARATIDRPAFAARAVSVM